MHLRVRLCDDSAVSGLLLVAPFGAKRDLIRFMNILVAYSALQAPVGQFIADLFLFVHDMQCRIRFSLVVSGLCTHDGDGVVHVSGVCFPFHLQGRAYKPVVVLVHWDELSSGCVVMKSITIRSDCEFVDPPIVHRRGN